MPQFEPSTAIVQRPLAGAGVGNGASLILASVLLLGTGSLVPLELARAHVGTTLYPSRVRTPSAEEEQIVTSSVPGLITAIRAIFGLKAADMARVMDVSRTTLYDWMSEHQHPQSENQQRLRDLFELATRWHTAVGRNAETLQRQFADKSEILSILSTKDLRSNAVFAKLDLVAKARRGVAPVKSFAERMRDHGVRRVSSAESEW